MGLLFGAVETKNIPVAKIGDEALVREIARLGYIESITRSITERAAADDKTPQYPHSILCHYSPLESNGDLAALMTEARRRQELGSLVVSDFFAHTDYAVNTRDHLRNLEPVAALVGAMGSLHKLAVISQHLELNAKSYRFVKGYGLVECTA